MRTLADMFRRRDDGDWPARERPPWPRPPVRNGFEDPRDTIPVRWLPISNSRDQLIDSKLAAYLQCAASEDSAFTTALHSGYYAGYEAMRLRKYRAWREYMSALLFGYWPEHEGRLALPPPDVPRPGPTVSAVEGAMPVNAPGPGDTRILPTVRVGGVHLTLDPEPLPDLSRPGQTQSALSDNAAAPGQPDNWLDDLADASAAAYAAKHPDATVSFQVTGETQPIDRPHPDHGKPFTELEQEMARLDDAEDIQP